ncbi:MAG: Hsp20/alpha crystallin family protein [Bacteroidetes bacterium]|jgi:HSP20 family protein|nr:Hsp20/alpha crystallin family protein [Bacteroidota bacterium]
MNLIRFNQRPVSMLSELMEDLDRNFMWRSAETRPMMPAVNISENEDNFMLEMAAPGMQKSDFKINLDNNVLTLSSEKQDEQEENNENFSRKEFNYSSFSRSFTLPKSIDFDKIKADYKDGILKVSLPKREDAKVALNRQIEIA